MQYRLSFTGSEANIIETGTNSAGGPWDFHAGLIDGEGLAGTAQDIAGKVLSAEFHPKAQN